MARPMASRCVTSSIERRQRAVTLNKRFVASSFLKSIVAVFAVFLVQGNALPQGVTDSPQIKRASVNGVDLSYQEQGRGTPVVFVHGALSDLRVWNAQR